MKNNFEKDNLQFNGITVLTSPMLGGTDYVLESYPFESMVHEQNIIHLDYLHKACSYSLDPKDYFSISKKYEVPLKMIEDILKEYIDTYNDAEFISNDISLFMNLHKLLVLGLKKDGLYIFYNIDHNLHPKYQVKLMEIIYEIYKVIEKDNIRIVLSTNSPYLISTLSALVGYDTFSIYNIIKEGEKIKYQNVMVSDAIRHIAEAWHMIDVIYLKEASKSDNKKD